MDSGSQGTNSLDNLQGEELAKRIFLKKQSKSMINNQLVYKSNLYMTMEQMIENLRMYRKEFKVNRQFKYDYKPKGRNLNTVKFVENSDEEMVQMDQSFKTVKAKALFHKLGEAGKRQHHDESTLKIPSHK